MSESHQIEETKKLIEQGKITDLNHIDKKHIVYVPVILTFLRVNLSEAEFKKNREQYLHLIDVDIFKKSNFKSLQDYQIEIDKFSEMKRTMNKLSTLNSENLKWRIKSREEIWSGIKDFMNKKDT